MGQTGLDYSKPKKSPETNAHWGINKSLLRSSVKQTFSAFKKLASYSPVQRYIKKLYQEIQIQIAFIIEDIGGLSKCQQITPGGGVMKKVLFFVNLI